MIKNIKKYKIVIWFCAICYIAILIKVLFFKFPFYEVMMAIKGNGEGIYLSTNFIPLKTIFHYLGGEPTLKIAFKNLIGNIIIFLPFGFLLPILLRRANNFKIILFASIAFSLLIETTQLFFRIGSFDIDDLILNTIGGVLGYAILRITKIQKNILSCY